EYNEFVGTPFNDVFGFFLNGVNIALVPGTSTPVSINNVNTGANAIFYTDNDGGGLNIQYDGLVGQRTALFPTAHVNPGVENTITIAIADVTDQFYDSGILLAANSFRNGAPGAVGGIGDFVWNDANGNGIQD